MTTPSGAERRVGALTLPPETDPEVVALLQLAAGPVTDDELIGQASAVASFLAQRAEQRAEPRVARRRLPVRPIQVAAATLVTSVVLGGGLAAADVLPTPAQRWVARALDTVGIQVPSPEHPNASAPPALSSHRSQVLVGTAAGFPASETVPHSALPTKSASAPAAAGRGTSVPTTSGTQNGTASPKKSGASDASGTATTTHSSTKDTGAGNGPAEPASTGKAYGRGGNPKHDSGNSSKHQVTPTSSAANGRPASPGASQAAHASAPGQVKKQGRTTENG